jgi:hypothetical protein
MKLLFVRPVIILLTCLSLNNCFGQTLPDPGDDPLHNPDSTVESINFKDSISNDSATLSFFTNWRRNLLPYQDDITFLTLKDILPAENQKQRNFLVGYRETLLPKSYCFFSSNCDWKWLTLANNY